MSLDKALAEIGETVGKERSLPAKQEVEFHTRPENLDLVIPLLKKEESDV